MEYPSTPSFMSPEGLEKTGKSVASANMNSLPSPLQQSRNLPQDHVAILWDIENCPVPSDVRPEDVAGNIRMALRVHPVIKGAVTMFSAYGDFNAFPRRLREGCQRTGVKLIDVPNGRKDAADKAILVDMFLFALDNPPPSSIMLISGDVDFAPALHILGQRGYTVILVIPANVGVSSALSNAGSFVWDWPSVARGEGFLPPAKAYTPSRANPKDLAGVFRGCHITGNADGPNEEEAIVYRGISQKLYDTRDFSMVSQSFSEYNSASVSVPNYHTSSRSNSLPCAINEVLGAPCDQNDLSWVQPGDLNGLKGQLVKMLQLSGGCLPLTRIPAEYQKMYGRPFYISEYGAPKLVNLIKKMADALSVEGKGQKRFVYLRNTRTGQSPPSFVLLRRERKEKIAQEDTIEFAAGTGSSEECSDEERVGVELKDKAGEQSTMGTPVHSQIVDLSISKFKYELQEILVSYSCRVFLGCFEAIYEQRYKRPLDYQSFGVNVLEELLEKVKDVVVLQEEPVSKRKFLVAAGG
ncbi:OLC1v1000093C1 [Oldenlandia corymbosa var. corymbosa]|uniref:OLC1v1000093C1 n=1 Tax=Oldenlandia corymbosa var. corymbosa TaxID=529605 RepID=A0AAV1D2Z0_OLDCO|nr:OLC1v1000093C1 [Oldenlandia corymbosa var. corymbosa]